MAHDCINCLSNDEDKSDDVPIPISRELLNRRDYKVDLDRNLGVCKITSSSPSGGYIIAMFVSALSSTQSIFSNISTGEKS